MWQDVVFSAGGIVFSIALLPSVFSKDKPNLCTSLLTAIVLTVYSLTFYSMGLFYSGTCTCMTALLWWILFLQKGLQGVDK